MKMKFENGVLLFRAFISTAPKINPGSSIPKMRATKTAPDNKQKTLIDAVANPHINAALIKLVFCRSLVNIKVSANGSGIGEAGPTEILIQHGLAARFCQYHVSSRHHSSTK
jgi:hypothetical protein